MKTIIQKSILISVTLFYIGIMVFFASGCKAQTVDHSQSLQLIDGKFSDVYEDTSGLHLVIDSRSEILIELEDEVDTYYFEYYGNNAAISNGKVEKIQYLRIGNDKIGCAGVYVVLSGELYRIDSQFNHIK